MIPEEYYKAGNILAMAIKKTRDKIKPGVKLLKICEYCENQIENLGGKTSFPVNIDINEVGAHYTSPPNDESVVPENSLVKLDAGAQIDGYISDMAVSTNFGEDIYNNYIQAAEEALETAIKHIKPGLKVRIIGALIEKKIKSFNLKPISNLSGHQVRQYNLHAGQSIPNIASNESGHFIKDEVYAIEPFVTDNNSAGTVKAGSNAYIYQFRKRKKNLIKFLSKPSDFIQKKFKKLPFCKRYLPEKFQISDIIERLISIGVLHAYPVLIESSNGIVAQAEKTILVTSDGCEVLTQ